MNIIYRLVNLNRLEGRRYYIGSKTECYIEEVDEVSRIVSAKTGKLYYGSSTCLLMKEDMQDGHIFNAEVLEEVPQKSDIIDVENKWIKYFDAVESSEYYNKNYATIGKFVVDQSAPYNQFGETIMQYGKIMSSFNKRNNTAKKAGFQNFGEMYIWIHNEILNGKNGAEIAKILGVERHQPRRYIAPYDMDKVLDEYDPDNILIRDRLRMLVCKGCSPVKAAEIENIEVPTAILYLGDFHDYNDKAFLVAYRKGKTKEEMEIEITKKILDGAKLGEVAREMNLCEATVKRYFLRCIRARLKSSDL